MNPRVADFIVQRLCDWGVRRVFGYPGDGINGLSGAIARQRGAFDYVRVRHEEMAAFMACAHAKFTGETGVCLATSGPGAIHLLNGLYDARMDHAPVLALVGQQATSALGSDYQQEVDLHALFKDVACYVETIVAPAQARHVLDRALRIAGAERGVACVIVPNDVQLMDAVASPPRAHGHVYSGVGPATPRPFPAEAGIEAAAAVLNACGRIAILAGAGALHAGDELVEIADVLGAGIAKALLGKAAVPDDLAGVTGAIGLLGTRPSWRLMQECDGLLLVGTTFPYAEFLPRDGQARAVQIDLDPRNVGMRYPTEVNLIGDSAETLRRLLPLLERKRDRTWRESVEADVREWRRQVEATALQPADPVNPQRVFHELSPRLPERAILCGDSGSSTHWFARDLQLRRGMMASLSGKLASMGSAVPYAIAAKLAHPDRPVIAIAGDGAMQMNGNAELVTVQRYARRWTNPCFVVMVLVNHDLNEVTWEQRLLAGDPRFDAAQAVEPFPYARYAELIGFEGIRVERPEDVAAGWERALAAQRPVLIEFLTDPDVPPLPPHVTAEQVRSYLGALRRDPDRRDVLEQTLRQIFAMRGAERERN